MRKWNEYFQIDDLILHEDDQIIIVNKPPGINTQDDLTKDLSLIRYVSSAKRLKLHLANRIDRPVSGIVVMLKKGAHIKDYSNLVKHYLAIVPQEIPQNEILQNYIKRDGRRKRAVVSAVQKEGYKLCKLEYQVIHRLEKYAVIQVLTYTGRFHQIRSQLSYAGFPIRGDVKYGARRGNKDRSIDLHAYQVHIPKLNKTIVARAMRRERIWDNLNSLDIFQSPK